MLIAGSVPSCDATAANGVKEMGSIKFVRVILVPHCILVAFGGENYGKYARSLKRFAFIAIQYLLWLWTIPKNPKR